MTALRHIILLLTLSCLMSACSSSGVDEPEACGAVKFDSDALSRGSLTTSDNLRSYPFAVYGDMTRMDDNEPITICDATEVRYDSSAGEWTYDDPRYWFPRFQYSFVAHHPADATCLYDPKYKDNQLKFTYRQPSDYTKAQDILIAAHRRNYNEGSTFPVRFRFEHILSNINIAVIYKDNVHGSTPLKFNEIILRDIPTAAEYAVAPASLSEAGIMTSDLVYHPESADGWITKQYGVVRIRLDKTNTVTIPNDNASHRIFSDSNALLLIPNPDGGAEMDVSYTVYEDDGKISHDKSDTVIIPNGWQAGRSYLLTLTIANGKVQFSFDVTDWKDGDEYETTVPRK